MHTTVSATSAPHGHHQRTRRLPLRISLYTEAYRRFAGLGTSPSIPATPVQIVSGTDSEGDLTQANKIADLLIVDITRSRVLKSVLPSSGRSCWLFHHNQSDHAPKPTEPKIDVADGGGQQNNIQVFKDDGNPDTLNSVCGTFSHDERIHAAAPPPTASAMEKRQGQQFTCVTALAAEPPESAGDPSGHPAHLHHKHQSQFWIQPACGFSTLLHDHPQSQFNKYKEPTAESDFILEMTLFLRGWFLYAVRLPPRLHVGWPF